MSNSCALMTEKKTEQNFNYMTAKLIKYNINNKYGSSSAVKRASDCERIEDKREIKKRKKIAFILN